MARLSLFATLMLQLAGTQLAAQQLLLTKLDPSDYPTVRGKVILLDANGTSIRIPLDGRIRLTDDGLPVDPSSVTLNCPPVVDPDPVSMVVVIDKSGSMDAPMGTTTRLSAARNAAAALVRALTFTPTTALAITAFSTSPEIVSDFSADRDVLVQAVNGIELGSATYYEEAFLDSLTGALPLLATRPPSVPRAIVFITDGEPNRQPDVDSIVARARSLGIAIHTVRIGGMTTPLLRRLASETGGLDFGEIDDEESLRGLLALLAVESQGGNACDLSWTAPITCLTPIFRQVVAVLDQPAATAHARYRHGHPRPRVSVSPPFADFGRAAYPDIADLPFVIRADGGTYDIRDITIGADSSFTIADWGGISPPFTLAAGGQRTITIRFRPTDSIRHDASIVVDALPCSPAAVPIVGGSDLFGDPRTGVTGGASIDQRRLVLVTPRGGETYSACDSITIRWRGVAPETPVDIEWSSDDGATWAPIVRKARGLSHVWRPPAHGDRFRVRVSSRNEALDTTSTVAGGGAYLTDTLARYMDFRSPVGVDVDGSLLYIAEAGRHRVRRVDLQSGLATTIVGTGSNGYSGDGGAAGAARLANPNDVAASRSHLFIADYSNNRVRSVDLSTGIITTFAGNGLSGYTGDGGNALSATFSHPSHLALTSDALFVTDRDNNRVRRIDLATQRVTTIAGGGTNPLGDGGRAIDAMLTATAGLEVIDDTLFLAEEGSHRVRAVSLLTGMITTIAGTGTPGYSGDNGLAGAAELNRPTGLTAFDRFLIVADEGNHVLRAIDRYTRRILPLAGAGRPGITGDDGDARLALLNAPEGLATTLGAIFVADVSNDRVRRIALPDRSSRDSTSTPFRVARPTLAVDPSRRTIAFLPTSTDAVRDSLLSVMLCNRGNESGVIDHAEVLGRDSIDFEVLSPIDVVAVEPGQCIPLAVRFNPTSLGTKRALLAIGGSCMGYDTVVLSGTGLPPCSGDALAHVDLGTLEAGSQRDSTILSAICNNGATVLDGTVELHSGDGDFSVLAGGGPFSIAPGACHAVRVRFVPSAEGRRTATLDFGLPTSCAPARTLLYGIGRSSAPLRGPHPIRIGPQLCLNGAIDSTVTIQNVATTTVQVTEAYIDPPAAGFTLLNAPPDTTNPWIIEPGASVEVQIRMNSIVVGDRRASLRLAGPSVPQTVFELHGRRDSVGIGTSEPLALLAAGSGSMPPYSEDSVVLVNTGTIGVNVVDIALTGSDAASFVIMAPPLPVRLEVADSVRVRIGALSTNTGAPRRARVTFVTSPQCDSTSSLEVVQEGTIALARISRIDSLLVLCPEAQGVDTSVEVCNPTRLPLIIDSLWVEGSEAASFTVSAALPITVGASACVMLPIRFEPTLSGVYRATLHLRHDGAGDSGVDLTGRRNSIDMRIDEDSIVAGPIVVGDVARLTLHVANRGDRRGALQSFVDGPFTIVRSIPDSLDPGESSAIEIDFSSAIAGRFVGRYRTGTPGCSGLDSCRLVVDVVRPTPTILELPVDSAAPGAHVSIPLSSPDLPIVALTTAGVDSFSIELRFDGTILWPRGAEGATATILPLQADGAQRLILHGRIPLQGDTLVRVVCDVLSGTRGQTPLAFTQVLWFGGTVETSTVDGLFTRLDGCGPNALATGPRLNRAIPNPMYRSGLVEIELPAQTDVHLSVVDPAGSVRLARPIGRLAQGVHALGIDVSELASGHYWVVVDSPLGFDRAPLTIVR